MNGNLLIMLPLILVTTCLNVAAGETESSVRQANLPSTTDKQLAQLSNHPDWQVRQTVAMNRKTPLAVLYALAEDIHRNVRIAVATNLSTDEKTLMKLAHDSDVQVRSVVARFEYVTAEILEYLSHDKDPDIRLEVARNWNTDINTLHRLARDEFEDVRDMALGAITDRSAK